MASQSSQSSQHPLKRRRAVTDLERRNIRQHHTEHPGTQQALISWFNAQTGHLLNQAQISKILSPKYSYLDNNTQPTTHLQSKRHFKSDWPDLEAALFEWQQRMQHKGGIITGDILKAVASTIWSRLSQYQNTQEPKWSNGWLEGFKKRHKIKEYVLHGEAGSAAIDCPEMVTQMADIRLLCKQYHPRDIFNMDETGLYWKRTPNRTLATEPGSGNKKAKDRITLALTANADGSEKLDPWIIGSSKNPRCFKNINRRLLQIQYRYNKSKWMTGVICEEFLRWFDHKMQGRKVLLLIDNFSGHELATLLVGGIHGLQNTRVVWLPANTTSHWQPMDQGIIAAFKLYYRQQWVSFILQEYEAERNPLKSVTLLHAIQWSVFVWNYRVIPGVIQRCFWKSTCVSKPLDLANPLDTNDQQQVREQLQAQIALIPDILDPIPLEEFIQPIDEQIIDNENDILNTVIESYSQDLEDKDMSDEDEVEAPKVTIFEAIQALERLKLFELQQENGEASNILALERIERAISLRKSLAFKQSTIESFFQG